MNFSLLDPSFLRWYAQGVLRHIHTPSAWHSFALVCKYFAHLCRQEAGERKLEFCVDGAMWMRKWNYKVPQSRNFSHQVVDIFAKPMILPNGLLHGVDCPSMEKGNAEHEGYTFDTGLLISTRHRGGHVRVEKMGMNERMQMVRNVLIIFRSPFFYVQTTFYKMNSQELHYVNVFQCDECHKPHLFDAFGYPNNFVMERSCLQKDYRISLDVNARGPTESYLTFAVIRFAKKDPLWRQDQKRQKTQEE